MRLLPDVGLTHRAMSLRDYFATHLDQPGQVEVAAMAGVRVRGVGATPWEDKDAPRWEEWWGSLPSDERLGQAREIRTLHPTAPSSKWVGPRPTRKPSYSAGCANISSKPSGSSSPNSRWP